MVTNRTHSRQVDSFCANPRIDQLVCYQPAQIEVHLPVGAAKTVRFRPVLLYETPDVLPDFVTAGLRVRRDDCHKLIRIDFVLADQCLSESSRHTFQRTSPARMRQSERSAIRAGKYDQRAIGRTRHQWATDRTCGKPVRANDCAETILAGFVLDQCDTGSVHLFPTGQHRGRRADCAAHGIAPAWRARTVRTASLRQVETGTGECVCQPGQRVQYQ